MRVFGRYLTLDRPLRLWWSVPNQGMASDAEVRVPVPEGRELDRLLVEESDAGEILRVQLARLGDARILPAVLPRMHQGATADELGPWPRLLKNHFGIDDGLEPLAQLLVPGMHRQAFLSAVYELQGIRAEARDRSYLEAVCSALLAQEEPDAKATLLTLLTGAVDEDLVAVRRLLPLLRDRSRCRERILPRRVSSVASLAAFHLAALCASRYRGPVPVDRVIYGRRRERHRFLDGIRWEIDRVLDDEG